ncbi:MAG: peptidylprolyl isomerase [Xanthobacteraceae bacterium]
MLRMIVLALLALISVPAAAQTAPPANPRVAFETTEGRFVVEVDAAHAPITAANFLRYVDAKRLDNIRVYRTAKAAERFGFIQFGLENDPKRVFPPIRHEPTTKTGIKHIDGVISMPRRAPGTAQGEFTISLGTQTGLDADPAAPGDNLGYAAFGRVVEGMDVVLKIFDAPVSPTATVRGVFKGEVPVKPVRILTVRRIKG